MEQESIIDSLRLVEELKIKLLKNSVEMNEILMNSACEEFYEQMTEKTVDLLICTYLLAKSAGISYGVTESALRKRLKLYLLESKDSDILNKYAVSLAEYAFG